MYAIFLACFLSSFLSSNVILQYCSNNGSSEPSVRNFKSKFKLSIKDKNVQSLKIVALLSLDFSWFSFVVIHTSVLEKTLFGWKKIFGYKNSLEVKMLLIFFTLFHSFINSEITLLILSLCLVIAILGIVVLSKIVVLENLKDMALFLSWRKRYVDTCRHC